MAASIRMCVNGDQARRSSCLGPGLVAKLMQVTIERSAMQKIRVCDQMRCSCWGRLAESERQSI
jgi:hypothetical protein